MSERKHTTEELLRAIDTCPSIDKLFELVKNEHIVIQMKSFSSASSLPRQEPKLIPDLSPLDSLRIQVRQAVLDQARREAAPPPYAKHTKEQLLRAVQTCPSIDKLFELVKNEHIVIRMKSFHSASSIPMKDVPLVPDKSPLDSLKEQVCEAIMTSN